MYTKTIDGFEVWTAIEQAGTDGPLLAVIMVRSVERNLVRRHELRGFHYASRRAAEDFVNSQMNEVTGVSSDGSLRF